MNVWHQVFWSAFSTTSPSSAMPPLDTCSALNYSRGGGKERGNLLQPILSGKTSSSWLMHYSVVLWDVPKMPRSLGLAALPIDFQKIRELSEFSLWLRGHSDDRGGLNRSVHPSLYGSFPLCLSLKFSKLNIFKTKLFRLQISRWKHFYKPVNGRHEEGS